MRAYIYEGPFGEEFQGVGENAQDFFYRNVPSAYGNDERYLKCLGDVEISPCPFCGSSNIKVESKGEIIEQGVSFEFIHFCCKDCWTDVKISGNRPYEPFNVKEAIELWNRHSR